MARLLITGGAGFIGSHTCVVLLEAGHVDRPAGVALALIALKPCPRPREPRPRLLLEHPSTVDE